MLEDFKKKSTGVPKKLKERKGYTYRPGAETEILKIFNNWHFSRTRGKGMENFLIILCVRKIKRRLDSRLNIEYKKESVEDLFSCKQVLYYNIKNGSKKKMVKKKRKTKPKKEKRWKMLDITLEELRIQKTLKRECGGQQKTQKR